MFGFRAEGLATASMVGRLEIGSGRRSNLRDVVTEADSAREMAFKKSKEISTLASRRSTALLCADKKWYNVMAYLQMGQQGRNVHEITVAALKATAYKVESKGNNNHQDDNDNVGGQATEIKLIQEGKVMEDCFQNIHGCDSGSIIAKQSEFSNHKTSNELVTKGSYFVSMASSALLLLINVKNDWSNHLLSNIGISAYIWIASCAGVCVTMCFDNSIIIMYYFLPSVCDTCHY